MKDAEYYEVHTEEFDNLSDEDKDRVINGEILDGDTEAKAEEISESPAAEPEKEPVLLAADGKHEIPYSELISARQKVGEWEQFAKQQAAFIEELQAAKKADAGTGDTKSQDDVLEAYAGEFPEVAEDLKPYIQRMIDDGIKAGLAEFKEQVEQRVAPVERTTNEVAAERYFGSIRAAHPDADEIVGDTKFTDWIKAQPKAVQAVYGENLEYKRPATDLIEMFDAYKKAVPPAVAGKATDILANVKRTGPGSLTDMPSTTIGQHDEIEAMRNMSSSELERKFFGKSPEEVNRLVSKLL